MNADPRRPEKVQRYVPKSNSNGEDLTPDYMNIMGQHPTAANAAEPTDKHPEPSVSVEPNLQAGRPTTLDEVLHPVSNELAVTSNATNVIPTSPQYGVAIIPNATVPTTAEIPPELITQSTEPVMDTSAKPTDESKDAHSTPSKNDRFKVVKIASLEPFKRGRWKCMDYLDEAPPPNTQAKVTQSTGNIPVTGGVYLQTQSLPQQQIQQMLMQGGFTNGAQFFPNVQAQVMPQTQYFYPQVANIPGQSVPQQVAGAIPTQFINNQQYFPAGVIPNTAGFTIPQGYANIQYVPANLIQNPNSAFVPTSQTVQLPANFQQSQTYAGQPNVSQSNVAQPLVNGHAYPQPNEQVPASSLPTQTVKSVIMNSQPVVNHTATQNHMTLQNNIQNSQPQTVPVVQNQQYQQQNANYQQQVATQPTQIPGQSNQNIAPLIQAPLSNVQGQPPQSFDQNLASNVYTNPQFTISVNSLTVLENNENPSDVNDSNSVVEATNENPDDPAKTNPVVNAIDNKIEQAMDLVKSHLMYTVREEVEVLKEKIAELMERIQQLETENNFLRSQIPKSQNAASTTNNATFVNAGTPSSQANVAVTPSPNVMANNITNNPVISSAAGSQTNASVNNASQQQQNVVPNAANIPNVPKDASAPQ